jgi:hypothetical protein
MYYSSSQLLLEIEHQQYIRTYSSSQLLLEMETATFSVTVKLMYYWVRLFFTCYFVAQLLWSRIISEKFTFRQNFLEETLIELHMSRGCLKIKFGENLLLAGFKNS